MNRSNRTRPPAWSIRLLVAVGLTAIALACRLGLQPLLGDRFVGVLFLAAVAISAWYGGLVPGLVSTLCSVAAMDYFFLAPVGSFAVSLDGAMQVGIFGAIALLVSALLGARRRVEARLRAGEAQYRMLFDHNPHPMWVFDPQSLAFLAVNDMAVRHYGYTREEFLGMTLKDIRPFGELPQPREILTQPELRQICAIHQKKDGTRINVEITRNLITFAGREAWLVLAHDVTERVLTEETLRKREEQLRLVTDAMPALISYIDADQRYRFANRAYEEWFGQSRESIDGRSIREVLGDDAYTAIAPHVRRALAGETVTYESRLPYRDGPARYIMATYVPHVDGGGQVRGFYALVTDLTARKQVEEELRASESRFRAMTEASPVGVFVTDLNGDCLYTNRVYHQISGLSQEQARGQGWAGAIHPEDRERVRREWYDFAKDHGVYHSQHRFIRPDGTMVWASVNAAAIRDGEHIGGYVGTVEDVTESRRAEQELRRRLDQLQTIYRMTDAVSRATAVEEIYEEALQGLQRALKADRAAVLLFDNDRVMRFKAWCGLSDSYRRAIEGHSPWTTDTKSPEPILVSNLDEDPSLAAFRETILAEGIRALGFIPLVSHGKLLGKMMIYYDQPYRFRKEDVELAQNMANHIAFAIERKRVEDEVQSHRERLETILTNVPGVVWEAWGNPDSTTQRINFVSDYVQTMLGYSLKEWLATPNFWLQVVHPDDQERAGKEAAAIYAGGKGGVSEFRWLAKDGRTVWVEARSMVVRDHLGRAVGMRGVTLDITDRRLTEEALRDSRARLSGIIGSAMDAIMTIDASGRIIVFNTAAERMFRFPATRAIGQSIERFIPERFRKTSLDGAEAGDNGHGSLLLGTPIGLRADGEEFPIEATLSQVEASGQTFYTVIIRDVTERFRAERRVAAHHAVTCILAESSNIRDASARMLQTVCETLGWDLGAFWSIDGDAQGLRCVELWQRENRGAKEFEADSRQRIFTPGRGLPGQVWATAQPLWIANVVEDGNFPRAPIAAKEGLHGAFAIPVILDGRVLGVLEFFSHSIQEPDQDLLRMMSTIGSQIGQFIERRRVEERIKSSLAEKDVLLKEIHHRVKNNMQVISSLLSLQADQITDAKMLELFEDSQHRIQSMALVHENLYQSSDLSQVNLGEYLRGLAEELWRSYGSRAETVRLVFQVDQVLVGIDTAIPCGLIVNELVSNALKHAFPEGRSGEVRIRLRRTPKGQVFLAVQDTGVGLPTEFDLNTAESLGLRLVNTLIEQLDGTLELDRSEGTLFAVTFSGLKHQGRMAAVEATVTGHSG